MRRDRYKLNMCRSRMTPKSLAEAEGFRGRPREVTVGVEGNPLSAAWSRMTSKSLAEAEALEAGNVAQVVFEFPNCRICI